MSTSPSTTVPTSATTSTPVDPQLMAFIQQQQNALQAMQQRIQQLEHQTQQQAVAAAAALSHAPMSSSVNISSSSSSSSSSQRLDKLFKPEPFSNEKGKNIDYWTADLDRYFNARGAMSDAEQVNYVQVLLKGQVGQWYDGVVRDGSKPLNNWNDIKTALLERYRPADVSRIARAALDSLQQLSSVTMYNELFMNTVERINSFPEGEKVYNYVKGLKHHIRMEVDRESPTTLNAAMISAQKAEIRLRLSSQSSANKSSNGYMTRYHSIPATSNATSSTSAPMDLGNMFIHGHSGDENDDGTETNQLNAMSQRRSYTANSSTRVLGRLTHEEIESLKKQGKCFHCKQHGHMKNACPGLAAASKNSKK